MKQPKITHAEMLGHPSNYRVKADRIFTLCGRFCDAATELEHVDNVTCEKCRAILKAREEISV